MSTDTPEEFQSWLKTCTRVRYARVSKSLARDDQIERYLPGNYQVIESYSDYVIIAGADVAGWTLDAYVIPRLSSGLITSKELRTVTAAVYHNLSRDASFGLNTVFRPSCDSCGANLTDGSGDGINGHWRNCTSNTATTKQEAKTEDEYHPLVKVFEYRTYWDGDMEMCERAWVTFQNDVGIGPDHEAYKARRLRSLCKGDVVTIGGEPGEPYSVEGGGFKQRFRSELRIVTDVRPYGEMASLSTPWTEDEPNG